MSEVKIKELDKSLIHQANSNSMSGKRGDISAHEYEVYCQKVMSWNIPDSRKQKIVDQIYAKWSEQLRHEAAHVSVAVAGPARYNAKKLDHSDTILRLSSEFVEWFNGLQEQVWQGRIEDKDAKEIARLVDDIKFCIERPTYLTFKRQGGTWRYAGRCFEGSAEPVQKYQSSLERMMLTRCKLLGVVAQEVEA